MRRRISRYSRPSTADTALLHDYHRADVSLATLLGLLRSLAESQRGRDASHADKRRLAISIFACRRRFTAVTTTWLYARASDFPRRLPLSLSPATNRRHYLPPPARRRWVPIPRGLALKATPISLLADAAHAPTLSPRLPALYADRRRFLLFQRHRGIARE